jgi:hypothetical protein
MLTFHALPGTLLALQLLAVGCAPPREAPQARTDLLPALTGPHKTGMMSFHWKDAARESWRRARPTTSAS